MLGCRLPAPAEFERTHLGLLLNEWKEFAVEGNHDALLTLLACRHCSADKRFTNSTHVRIYVGPGTRAVANVASVGDVQQIGMTRTDHGTRKKEG